MCNYFSDYKITNSNNIDKLKKLESWELAIGLNEVDNLKPSEYLIELTKDSIDNNKTYNEVEEALYTYYSNQDLSNKEIQKTLEADIVTTRIVSIINDRSFRFSPIYLKTIHKKLFSGAFPEELEKYASVFVTSAIHKSSHNGQFSYDKNFYAKDADELNIMLPEKNGKPDYNFMKTLISAIHKIVIKEVVEYADEKISVTKLIIN